MHVYTQMSMRIDTNNNHYHGQSIYGVPDTVRVTLCIISSTLPNSPYEGDTFTAPFTDEKNGKYPHDHAAKSP